MIKEVISNRQAQAIFVIFLMAVLIVGGLYTLRKYLDKNSGNNKQNTVVSTNTPSFQSTGPRGLPPLSSSPSAKQQQEFFQAAIKAAKEVEGISLTNCQPDVSSIRLKVGSSLKIKNNDEKLIVVDLNSANMFPIQPRESVDAKLKLSPGIHFLACQHSAADYNSKVAVVEVVK